MLIQNFFILSSTGQVLIEKHWSGKVKRTVCDLFWEEASKKKQGAFDTIPPVIATAKYYMVHVKRFDLYFLSTVQKETPPLFVIECQHKIVDIFKEYFETLNETVLRENFSTVYQLLDEMVDGGFPSEMEPNMLKEMIMPPTLTRKLFTNLTGDFMVAQNLAEGALSKIPWRKADVKYVTNEIYFDFVEHLDCIISANDNVIKCDVWGECKAICRLSGMPDLTLSFTRSSLLDDVALHRCVRINRYQRERVVSFIPPDGRFTLFNYRVKDVTSIPLTISPNITYTPGVGRVRIAVGVRNTDSNPVAEIAIIIPFPSQVRSTSLSANVGLVKMNPTTQVCKWIIGKFPKDKSPVLEGTLTLPPDLIPDESPTIQGEFVIKMLSVSGLKVDGLAIRGVKYKPFKGVRYITQHGRFQVRTG